MSKFGRVKDKLTTLAARRRLLKSTRSRLSRVLIGPQPTHNKSSAPVKATYKAFTSLFPSGGMLPQTRVARYYKMWIGHNFFFKFKIGQNRTKSTGNKTKTTYSHKNAKIYNLFSDLSRGLWLHIKNLRSVASQHIPFHCEVFAALLGK